jgi:hypothetical protein
MYANAKMITVETLPRMGGREKRRMMEGGISTMIYCKNFCKFTMCSQYNNNNKRI